jgi:hypothetical protein
MPEKSLVAGAPSSIQCAAGPDMRPIKVASFDMGTSGRTLEQAPCLKQHINDFQYLRNRTICYLWR